MMLKSLQESADVTFLALVAWREARGESDEAIAAVCHAVMNRVHHTDWWGRDVMSVVSKKWQFSSMTDPNDRQLTTWPQSDMASWRRCLRLAHQVYTGALENPVPGADSYYDDSIPAPYWADPAKMVAQIGPFRFYDLDGDHYGQH